MFPRPVPVPVVAPRRLHSLGTKLVVATTLVLAMGSALLFVELTSRERDQLSRAKYAAAAMVADLMATMLAAPLDFSDEDAARAELDHLRTNREIVSVSLWAWENDTKVGSWAIGQEPLPDLPDRERVGDARLTEARLSMTRTVRGPDSKPLGRLALVFSLDAEREAYAASRTRLFWICFAMAAGSAAVLLAMARRTIISPVRALASAARRLESGQTDIYVAARSRDEIGQLAHAFNTMGHAVAQRQHRFEAELDIATRIQTSILPRDHHMPGLEIAAAMQPATEVGGDYYDVMSAGGGGWLGIGDVSGHGLNAGLVMLMVQSGIAALVRQRPEASPSEVVTTLNRVVYDNVRARLQQGDHATLCLLRWSSCGRLAFAGGHEDLLVCRAAGGPAEIVPADGAWVGSMADVTGCMPEAAIDLDMGDVFLLYTDGLTEAPGASGELFGQERLLRCLEEVRHAPVAEIRDHLLDVVGRWTSVQRDDVTLVVARRVPVA